MLKRSPTRLSVVLQLLIDVAGKDKVSGSNDEIRILLTFSISKKSTRAGYLFSNTQKAFNNLQ